MLRVPRVASDYDAQMAENLGGRQAGQARAGGAGSAAEGWEAGSGAGLCFLPILLCKPPCISQQITDN